MTTPITLNSNAQTALTNAFGATYANSLIATITAAQGSFGNGSQTLASMLESFTSDPNNHILVGTAGLGTGTASNTDGGLTITVDPHVLVNGTLNSLDPKSSSLVNE